MPASVMLIDAFGLLLGALGFNMVFRQRAFRNAIGRPKPLLSVVRSENGEADPLDYILRIAGVMLMAFGVVLAGIFTLFNLA